MLEAEVALAAVQFNPCLFETRDAAREDLSHIANLRNEVGS